MNYQNNSVFTLLSMYRSHYFYFFYKDVHCGKTMVMLCLQVISTHQTTSTLDMTTANCRQVVKYNYYKCLCYYSTLPLPTAQELLDSLNDLRILTATAILPSICSGMGRFVFFNNLSKHVAINSMQIHTSLYKRTNHRFIVKALYNK